MPRPADAEPVEGERQAARISLRHNIGICAEIHRDATRDSSLQVPVEHVAHYATVLERNLYESGITSKQYAAIILQCNELFEEAEEDMQLWHSFLSDNFTDMGALSVTTAGEPILPLAFVLEGRAVLGKVVGKMNASMRLQASIDPRNEPYILQPEEEERIVKRLEFWRIRSSGKYDESAHYMTALCKLSDQIERWESDGSWPFWCDQVGQRMNRPLMGQDVIKAEVARKKDLERQRKAGLPASAPPFTSTQDATGNTSNAAETRSSPPSHAKSASAAAGRPIDEAAPQDDSLPASRNNNRPKPLVPVGSWTPKKLIQQTATNTPSVKRSNPFSQLLSSVDNTSPRHSNVSTQGAKPASFSSAAQVDLSRQKHTEPSTDTPSALNMPKPDQVHHSDILTKSTNTLKGAEANLKGFEVPADAANTTANAAAAPVSTLFSQSVIVSQQSGAALPPFGSFTPIFGGISLNGSKAKLAPPAPIWANAAKEVPGSSFLKSSSSTGPSIFDRLSNRKPSEQKVFNFGLSIVPSQKQLPNVSQGLPVPVPPGAPNTSKPKTSDEASASPIEPVSDSQPSVNGVEKTVDVDVSTSMVVPLPDQATTHDQTPKIPLLVGQNLHPSEESSLDASPEKVVAGSAEATSSSTQMDSNSPACKPILLEEERNNLPMTSNTTEVVVEQEHILEQSPIAPPLVHSSAPKADVSNPVAKIVAADVKTIEVKRKLRDPSIDGIFKTLEQMRGSLKSSDVLKEQAKKREDLHASTTGTLEGRICELMDLVKQTTSSQEQIQADFQHMKEECRKAKDIVANLKQRITEAAEERRKEQQAAAGQQAKLIARIATLEARLPTVVVPENVGATAQVPQKPTQIMPAKEPVTKVTEQKAASAIAVSRIAAKRNEDYEQAKIELPIDSLRHPTAQPADIPSISAVPAAPSKDMTETADKGLLGALTKRVDQIFEHADAALKDADKTLEDADKMRDLLMFPAKKFSALSENMAPAFKMFEKKIHVFIMDKTQHADRDTVANLHTTLRYIKHVHESQATLLDMEQNLRDLKAEKDSYVTSWGTKLKDNYDIARAYAQRLYVELNDLPPNDDMYNILRGHWFAEVSRLRLMVEDTGSKWGFAVGVSLTPNLLQELC
ncbi:hypothetical protein HBI12_055360 [Parastagonospora nodorum]|nr:hypothetical protein HBI12_055360 [Parastagonospora nodorum]